MKFLNKVSLLFGRRRFHDDLDEEMAFHRAEAEKDLVSEGMTPDAAHTAAARRFGNAARISDQSHETVSFKFENTWHDVRYGVRQLWSNPGFTTVILLTLALSIGANSAIFSVINGVLLKRLPYPQADRLVRIFLSSADYPRFPLNPFDFRDFRARNRSFEGIAAFTRGDAQLSGFGEPVRLYGFGITAAYFRVLGLQPQMGREFDYAAEIPGNGLQVILSDRLWRARFNADPGIIGRKITLNMQPFTVIGVMPSGTVHPGNEYHSMAYGEDVDLWWPFSFAGDPNRRGSHFIEGIGRLKTGVTPEQAESEMNAIMAQIEREHGGGGWTVLIVPLYREIVGGSRPMLFVLLGAVGMVLLIACANAANLLLARASSRQREIAVRLAVGASRMRVIRQLMTESLLISIVAGTLGLGLAFGGVKALVSLLPADFPRAQDIHVSVPVLLFTFMISALTGIIFGVAPAFQIARLDPRQGLQKGGRATTAGKYQSRLRNALVVSEVSLSCILLIGAGLMLRSLLNQLNLDSGFQKEHVLTATLSLPHATYSKNERGALFYNQLALNLRVLPGVENAGVGSDLPWTGYDENAGFNIEGKKPPPHQEFHGRYHMATAGYFEALGVPLVAGRFFNEGDRKDSLQVILVNRAMAERYWPGESVIGKRITFEDNPKDKDWITVVGVVGNIKDQPNSSGAEPAFWWPELQSGWSNDMSVVIRAHADTQLLSDALRNEVHRLDPNLAVADVRLIDRIVDSSVSTPRFAVGMVGMFAGLAILLAAIGTYGVISYSVSQRTSEFGVRMALGAPRSELMNLVLSHAMKLAGLGAVLGLLAAFAVAPLLKSLIFGVSPADPATFGLVAAIVILVALLAGYVPARRATATDPMNALRAE
jgi:predicted permease